MLSKILKSALQHKLTTGIILLLIIGGGYFGEQKLFPGNNIVKYVTAAVEKGTIIVSVSGSGQVSSLDQTDVKTQVNGEISGLFVKNGDEVKKGKLLAKLDETDLKKAVEEAQVSLDSTQLELEELISPPDELELLQAENALSKVKNSKTKAEEQIKDGYENALNTITDAFFALPAIIGETRDVLYSYDIAKSEPTINDYDWNEAVYLNSFNAKDQNKVELFISEAENDYKTARENYDQNLKNYKDAGYNPDNSVTENLLKETMETTRIIAQTIKAEINLLDFVVDYLTNQNRRVYEEINTYQTNLKSYYTKTNSILQGLSNTQQSLKDNEQTLIDAELSVREKELALEKLKEGPDEVEIKTKQLALRQKEDVLSSAKENLANSSVYSPFDGLISEVKIKNGDSVSNGTIVASIITKQKIAEISLNEVDAAKVKVGQKVTLTFDALSETSVSGKVFEVDTVGTVSQGVVSYGVKIAFDTQAEMVKSGMSVTADIITDIKQNVLVLPNSAIKSQGNSYSVELVEASEEVKQQLLASVSGMVLSQTPKSQTVETGLSNELFTEIVSGLKEGDVVVTSTITPNTTNTTQTNQNQRTQGFQIPGIR